MCRPEYNGITDEQISDAIEHAKDLAENTATVGEWVHDISSALYMQDDDPQGIADTIASIKGGLRSIANAITPLGAGAGTDANGGHVESLTEAAMGITKSLQNIADAIESFVEVASRAIDVYQESQREDD